MAKTKKTKPSTKQMSSSSAEPKPLAHNESPSPGRFEIYDIKHVKDAVLTSSDIIANVNNYLNCNQGRKRKQDEMTGVKDGELQQGKNGDEEEEEVSYVYSDEDNILPQDGDKETVDSDCGSDPH